MTLHALMVSPDVLDDDRDCCNADDSKRTAFDPSLAPTQLAQQLLCGLQLRPTMPPTRHAFSPPAYVSPTAAPVPDSSFLLPSLLAVSGHVPCCPHFQHRTSLPFLRLPCHSLPILISLPFPLLPWPSLALTTVPGQVSRLARHVAITLLIQRIHIHRDDSTLVIRTVSRTVRCSCSRNVHNVSSAY